MKKLALLGKILRKSILTKKSLNVLVYCLTIGMGIYFDWKVMEIIISLVFISIILRPVSSKLLAFPAILFLILTLILLFLKKDYQAEQMAVYAYYFLVMSAIMGIYETRTKKPV